MKLGGEGRKEEKEMGEEGERKEEGGRKEGEIRTAQKTRKKGMTGTAVSRDEAT